MAVLTNLPPRWIVFQLLEHCDLRCKMCYEWGDGGSYFDKKKRAKLDIDVVKNVITDLKDIKPYIGLFGGEPLLYPQLEELLKTAKQYGCNVDIPTNGTQLSKLADMLVDLTPRRLWISLDGPEHINDEQRGQGVYKKVTQGIQDLMAARRRKKGEFPKIGITFIVTPLTYTYIEEFFLKTIDLKELDHISIEFQTYLTEEKHDAYVDMMGEHFGVSEAPIARGLIQDLAYFSEMNIPELVRQITKVREFCVNNGIYFITYPKTIEVDNCTNYFSGRWDIMKDKRNRCAFPWLYTEVSASGGVTTCHTLYDVTFGNVNEQGILDIWNGEQYNKFRSLVRKDLLPICTGCARYYSDPSKK